MGSPDRESEARYRALAESALDAILQIGFDGVVQYASPAARTFGYAPGAMVGLQVRELVHPDDVEGIVDRLRRLGAGEPIARVPGNRFRLRRVDGSWAWVEGDPSAVYDEGGAATAVVTILRDVSDRHALEQAVRGRQAERDAAMAQLADNELRFRLLAEQSPDIIIRYDVEGRIQYVSPATRRYGVEPESLVGRNVAELLDPEEHERNAVWMAELAAGRPVPQGRANVWRSRVRGEWVHWEGRTNPILEDGRVVGAMSIIRDVTEREALEAALRQKQAETEQTLARLEESEARYRLIADTAADLIVRTDRRGVIEFVSPSVRMFGYEPEDIIGLQSSEVVHPDDVDGSVRRAIEAGVPPPRGALNQFRIRRKDGAYAWVEANPAPILDATGKAVGVVSLIRDITEQLALEDELRRKRTEAEAAVVAKSQFLATMSHEIRTPLTAMVGFAGLMAETPGLSDQARVYLDRISRSGEALTAIINNVLDFSKIEAGEVQLAPQPFDVGELAQAALAVVRDEAAAKGLTVTWAPEGGLPARVIGDVERLRQVLINLLNNAIKFTRTGGVVLAARYTGETLHFAVSDTGVGVPAGLVDRLFQRFSQIDGSNARAFGGTGLGLAIAKGLVELMGGEIGYTPRPGGGSVFAFTAPAPPGGEATSPPAEPETRSSMQALRVLVVDDAPLNRELILALLTPFALDAREAGDGKEAAATAAAERFDLILMDLQMPEMDGIAACEAIRASAGPNRDTPIVAVSASVQPADVEACRRAGMNDHVPKPISPSDLLAKVSRWTGAGASAAA